MTARIAGPFMIVVAFVGAWQLAISSSAINDVLGLDSFLIASPAQIAASILTDGSVLLENASVTGLEVVAGIGCALVIGTSVALALHLSPLLRSAVYPLVVASQTVPVIVLAPVLVAWFGFGLAPKLVIISLICFFPITVNTLDGLRSTPVAATSMMRGLDASRWQVLRWVEAPASLPGLFTGARIAVAVAVIGAVFGEWAGSTAGLGYLILQDSANLNTPRMFAAVLVLSVMAMALFGVVRLLERVVIRW